MQDLTTLVDAILERILSQPPRCALKGETLQPVRKASREGKTATSSQRPEEET